MRPIGRRVVLAGLGLTMSGAPLAAGNIRPLQFGLTPVFRSDDLDLLARLKDYLANASGAPVELVQRRTYEEITALLVSGELTAAWICGYPFVQHRERLSLVCVPLWNGQPLYRSYIITKKDRPVPDVEALRGDLHAFSDPNSNSGYLVTAALLAERRLRTEQFFRQTFFTYGHRNVVRAVASGLAQSGSVDGYVWETMTATEPQLTEKTSIVRASEWLGFPPVACAIGERNSEQVKQLHRAFLEMASHQDGRAVLQLLRLDGFSDQAPSLYEPIAAKMRLVQSLSS